MRFGATEIATLGNQPHYSCGKAHFSCGRGGENWRTGLSTLKKTAAGMKGYDKRQI